MRRGKIAPDGNEARKETRNPSMPISSRGRENQEQIRESRNENKGKPGKGFFACYLLTSLSPRHKGHTYIGFTVNPLRRIRQHNGEIGSGAWRTKSRRPWEMVVCIYGFPTNVSAHPFLMLVAKLLFNLLG
ncbi:Structure-specific endonuclease subunit SLX1 [Gossypium arboreum]|uniref:Structure-specific endonuclease subunit SLX1 n=1 Tax=Gossypium arboreum TaxID=29729 RepID=A0A0B0NLP1_GOSAR|nr:Structure-specific endonuclease subunit SLX1 [Gossypium arboreum]